MATNQRLTLLLLLAVLRATAVRDIVEGDPPPQTSVTLPSSSAAVSTSIVGAPSSSSAASKEALAAISTVIVTAPAGPSGTSNPGPLSTAIVTATVALLPLGTSNSAPALHPSGTSCVGPVLPPSGTANGALAPAPISSTSSVIVPLPATHLSSIVTAPTASAPAGTLNAVPTSLPSGTSNVAPVSHPLGTSNTAPGPPSLGTSNSAPAPAPLSSASSIPVPPAAQGLLTSTGLVPPPAQATVISTATSPPTLPSSTPTGNSSYGWIVDDGGFYGNLIIRNNCPEPLTLWSVGARHLHGYKSSHDGYIGEGDLTPIHLAISEMYIESYRINPPDVDGPEKYVPAWDKVAGQGVSVKISRTDKLDTDIFQFEYALVKEPKRGDTFLRLNYDVSLLDCARVEGVTDISGSDEQHKDKLSKCPGYKNGVAVTFDKNPTSTSCTPVYCSGESKCKMIYTWDRTRKNEMSLACNQEYKGDMTVDLCVNGNADANSQAKGQFDKWAATAKNIPPDFPSIRGRVPTGAPLAASPPISASVPITPPPSALPTTAPKAGTPPSASLPALPIAPRSARAKRARQEPSFSDLDPKSCNYLGTSTLNTCYTSETNGKIAAPTPREVSVTVFTTLTMYSAPAGPGK